MQLTNRNKNDQSRSAKSQRVAVLLPKAVHFGPQNRRYGLGYQASYAQVEVKYTEVHGQMVFLFGQFELVTSEGCHAGFYTTSADCDHE